VTNANIPERPQSNSEIYSAGIVLGYATAIRPQNRPPSGSSISWASWPERLPPEQCAKVFRARQTIYRAGETLNGVPMVSEGWAATVSRLSDGRRQILSFLLPGTLVSTTAVFVDRLNFYVEAITAVRYCSYDRTYLNQSLAADPNLIRAMAKTCLFEKEQAEQLVTNLGRRRAEERIAHLFLNLRARLKWRGLVRDDSFELPLRQQHIADATGLTPVHVNRVLGSLRKARLITICDGILKITDFAGLQRLADL
jgi:CRP/FNR family transcriptional regulator